MNSRVTGTATGGLVVSLAELAAGIIVFSASNRRDGRSHRRPRRTIHSILRNQFSVADHRPEFFDGWFRDTFRCSCRSFNEIVKLVNNKWDAYHGPIHHNAMNFVRKRVAVCLQYLARSGTVVDSERFSE